MHLPGDKRYTVTQEFCGAPEPRWVVRFCGEFVGQSKFKSSALVLAVGEKARREGALVIEAITADDNTTYQNSRQDQFPGAPDAL